MKIKWNQKALNEAINAATAKAEAQVNASMRETLWDVRNEMVGQPAETVHRVLVARLEALGLTPNEAEVRKIAEAIEKDDLVQ